MTYKEKHEQLIKAKERAKRLAELFPSSFNTRRKIDTTPKRQK